MEIVSLFEHLPIIGRFAIIFSLIVILPKLAEQIKLPGVIGLIGGGILLGPDLLGLVNPNGNTFHLFSELGKLLLMFFAGFEVNLHNFKQVLRKATGFGWLTFIIPLGTGMLIGYVLDFSLNSSLLVGSLMASHTLLGLPIVKQYGLSKDDSVMITVGATIFTDVLSMLVLAICLSVHVTGFSSRQLGITILELAIYVPVVLFGVSWVARKLFEIAKAEELRLAILMLMIAVSSFLAELIELEGIVGAFLTGIAMNRALGEDHKSAYVLGAVAQALFIPVFLLGTGFLVNIKVFTDTVIHHAGTVVLVVGGLVLSKYLAAWFFGKFNAIDPGRTHLMWSLSMPQVAATLAATMVAYNTFNAAGERLLNENMLNAIVVLVIVTAVAGPILTRRFSLQLSGK
jgi:Kef-type K+ transport system membrane component KefB